MGKKSKQRKAAKQAKKAAAEQGPERAPERAEEVEQPSGPAKSEQAASLGTRFFDLARVLALATLFVRLLVSGVASDFNDPAANAFIDGLMLMTVGLFLGGRVLERQPDQPYSSLEPPEPLRWPVLVLMAVTLVSVFQASALDIALRSGMSLVSTLLFFLVIMKLFDSPKAARFAMMAALAMAPAVALLGAYEYFVEIPYLARALESGQESLDHLPPELQAVFMQRLNARAAVGPFLIANLLAGYLVCAWPFFLLFAAWSWRQQLTLRALLFAALLGVVLLGMLLTRSKGMVPASLAAFWILLWTLPSTPEDSAQKESLFSRLVHLRKPLLAGVTALGVAVGGFGLMKFASNPEAYGFGLSLKVRLEYWEAGLKMTRKAPVLGVGLNNYASHYTLEKPQRSEETRFAHNSVVQILADQGFVGLFAWLLLILAVARVFLLGTEVRAESQGRDPPGPLMLYIAAGLAYFFLFVTGGRYGPGTAALSLPALLTLFGTAALGHALVSWESRLSDEQRVSLSVTLRMAMCALWAAFLGHGVFDFSHHCHGIFVNLLWLTACGLVLFQPMDTASKAWRLAFALPAGVLVLTLMIWPSLMRRYSESLEAGKQLAMHAKQLAAEGKQDEAKEAMQQSVMVLRQATEHYSLGRDAWHQLAASEESRWNLSGDEGAYRAALAAFDRAIACDPYAADLYFQKALALEAGLNSRLASLPELLEAIDKAVALYPTQPRYNYRAAQIRMRVLSSSRKNPRAQAQDLEPLKERAEALLRAALEAHEQARLHRVKLSDEQLKQAKSWLAGEGS